jgi:Fic family protein
MDYFTNPTDMEPLVIGDARPHYSELIGQVAELVEASASLDAVLAPQTAWGVSELVVGMNCYYSNLIEGHHTLPIEIDNALKKPTLSAGHRALQTLAAAHIDADRWAKEQHLDRASLAPFIRGVHREFCSRLPDELVKLADGTRMVAGEWRSREVSVGRHVAPRADMLSHFMERYASVYGQKMEAAQKGGFSRLDAILSSFAAHHRLVWIHPFPDGNGRVARIALDAMLRECGINGAHLWSMSRGFAKSTEHYKTSLADADMPRMGDLDGRGQLSEATLANFCRYAIQTAIDQIRFMGKLLALDQVNARIEGYFQRVRFDMKPEAGRIYQYVFMKGETERREAGSVSGMPERTARDVMGRLLLEGFLVSDSPKGKLRAGFPLHALGSIFPNLYPAGDMDVPIPVTKKPRSS